MLITLAIIGIIAALTVPTLMNKVQDHGFRSAFLKQFTIIKQAQSLAKRNGEDLYETSINANTFKETIRNYFKIVKGPYTTRAEFNSNLYDLSTIKYLNGTTGYGSSFHPRAIQTNDGTIIIIHGKSGRNGGILVDVNGVKGPNQFGKDIWLLEFLQKPDPGWEAHAGQKYLIENPTLVGEVAPVGAYGTQGNGTWRYPGSNINCKYDCKKNEEGLTCGYEIIRNRNFKIPEK